MIDWYTRQPVVGLLGDVPNSCGQGTHTVEPHPQCVGLHPPLTPCHRGTCVHSRSSPMGSKYTFYTPPWGWVARLGDWMLMTNG